MKHRALEAPSRQEADREFLLGKFYDAFKDPSLPLWWCLDEKYKREWRDGIAKLAAGKPTDLDAIVFVVLDDLGAVGEVSKEVVAVSSDRDGADAIRLGCSDPERVYVEEHVVR